MRKKRNKALTPVAMLAIGLAALPASAGAQDPPALPVTPSAPILKKPDLGKVVVAPTPAARPPGQATLPPLVGETSCPWGADDCNPPVQGVITQFNSLREYGDVLGFHIGKGAGLTLAKHWQGIHRLMVGQGKYMVVSRSGSNVSYAVVRMRSRPSDGGRMRSNRLGPWPSHTAPPDSDAVVRSIASDPGFDHSGGIQGVGKYLAVGLENGDRAQVAFWDFSAPETPRRVGTLLHQTGRKGAGTVSLAKLRGGRYLLIVGGAHAKTLDFYVSREGSTLERPEFDFATTWSRESVATELGNDRNFGHYQNLSIVTDTSGTLYLVGTHSTLIAGGQDWADLYRLENAGSRVRITKVAKRHLRCTLQAFARQCDFDAAAGVYVTPDRRLVLYATEHKSDGPGGSVTMMEFRTVPHRSTCPRIEDAWVELYDHSNFGGRSVMLDWVDRGQRTLTRFDQVEGFEDKASSARWCLPPGWRLRLYEHKNPCGGRHVDLTGNGTPRADAKFGDKHGAVQSFNDKLSCASWIGP